MQLGVTNASVYGIGDFGVIWFSVTLQGATKPNSVELCPSLGPWTGHCSQMSPLFLLSVELKTNSPGASQRGEPGEASPAQSPLPQEHPLGAAHSTEPRALLQAGAARFPCPHLCQQRRGQRRARSSTSPRAPHSERLRVPVTPRAVPSPVPAPTLLPLAVNVCSDRAQMLPGRQALPANTLARAKQLGEGDQLCASCQAAFLLPSLSATVNKED